MQRGEVAGERGTHLHRTAESPPVVAAHGAVDDLGEHGVDVAPYRGYRRWRRRIDDGPRQRCGIVLGNARQASSASYPMTPTA